MIKAFRVKIKPTEEQIKKLQKTWEGYLVAYDWAVEQQIRFFDAENLRRETAEDKKAFFISKFELSKLWNAYKNGLSEETNRPRYEPIRKDRLAKVTGVSAKIMEVATHDVSAACSRFFENAKGRPEIRPHSKFNKRYCAPEAEKADKPYLFINKEGRPVFSLYYRSGGPRFKKPWERLSIPIVLNNFRVTARNVYVSQLATGKEYHGKQDKLQLLERNRIPFSHEDPLKYSNPRISFDGINWWLSVGVELPDIKQELNKGTAIGVDVGVANESLAIQDNGVKYENHLNFNEYKKAEDRVQKLKKALDKKKNRYKKLYGDNFAPSNEYKRLQAKLAKAEVYLKNIKQYNRHNISFNIVRQNPELIGLETLDIEAMVSTLANTNNKKSQEWKDWHHRIMESGMYEIQRQIEYKAQWRGIKVQKIDQFFPSTQLCHNCGYKIGPIPPGIPHWTCPQCGVHHDRDVNAAINIRNEAVRCHENGIEVKKKKRTARKKKEVK